MNLWLADPVPILKREQSSYPPEPFAAPDGAPWLAAYVRGRQEKRLARHLLEQRVAFYLPMREQELRRAGRRFCSFLPLFPGYVFFRGDHDERRSALRSHVVVQLIDVADQRQLQVELGTLWRLERDGVPLMPHPYLAPGDPVEIAEGPFAGYRGHVLREKGRLRLLVSVSFLRRSVAAEFDRSALQPLRHLPRPARSLERRVSREGVPPAPARRLSGAAT